MSGQPVAACDEDEPRVRALIVARDLARTEYAKAKLAEDILRDLMAGIETGYPLADGSWEGDVIARAQAVLSAKWAIIGTTVRLADTPKEPT